jgi:hypothetical protein
MPNSAHNDPLPNIRSMVANGRNRFGLAALRAEPLTGLGRYLQLQRDLQDLTLDFPWLED